MRRRFERRLSVQTSFLHLGPQIDWGQSRVPPSDDRRFRMPLTTTAAAAAAALLSLITSLTKRDVRTAEEEEIDYSGARQWSLSNNGKPIPSIGER